MKKNYLGKMAYRFILPAIILVPMLSLGGCKQPAEPAPVTPVYNITLSQTGPYTFPAATAGYGAQTAKPVTITNMGNQATGALTAALSGANSTSFTLSTPTISNIAVGNTDTFTVAPITGLPAETYTATVTVSGCNGISANFGG
jgi:hypothetical protein